MHCKLHCITVCALLKYDHWQKTGYVTNTRVVLHGHVLKSIVIMHIHVLLIIFTVHLWRTKLKLGKLIARAL